MPIRLKCSCGKLLSVRDELAGKVVKCPACQSSLRVAVSAAAAQAAAATKTTAAAKPAPDAKPTAAAKPAAAAKPTARAGTARPATPAAAAAPDGSMDDLFHEAGFQLRTGKTCPGCFAAMASDAVLCTQCGLHLGTGDRLKAHAAQFEDEQSGEAYLRRAAADMERTRKMQEKLASGVGLPWWMLGLILFLLASATGVAVISVNLSRREDADVSFNALATLFLLAGIATSAVAIGAYAVVLYRACMESVKQGLLVLFIPPYILFYGFTRFSTVGKTLLVAIFAGAAAAGSFVASSMQQ